MSRTVVFIDDEAGLCSSFRLLARRAGLEAVTFTDPRDAIEYLGDHDVAVIVCDYRMPELDGLKVLAQLRAPVPFYLASGDLGVERFASHPGVTGVLPKPFALRELVEMLRAHVDAVAG